MKKQKVFKSTLWGLFMSKRKNKKYSKELKLEAVQAYLRGEGSLRQVPSTPLSQQLLRRPVCSRFKSLPFFAQPFFATKERPAFLWNAGLSDFCDYSNILWRQYLVSGIGSRPKYLPSVKSGKATGAPPIAMDASLSAVTAI